MCPCLIGILWYYHYSLMKKFLFAFLLLATFLPASATHTKGGWMYYEYLGPGINNPAHLRYRVGLNYYIECSSFIIEQSFNFSIFSAAAPFAFVQNVSVPLGTNTQIQNCNLGSCYPCISNIPTICYKILNYETIIELPQNAAGYILAKQRCCRIDNISNMPAPSNTSGVTYTVTIPGFNAPINNAHVNSSPRFNFNDTTIVCADNPFTVSFAAVDSEGDSLVYSLCDSYTGASQLDPDPATSSSPPFASVPYQTGFSGAQPLGSGVTINPVTGEVSGSAPPAGEYVITICVAEYRNGVRFAQSRKELHLKVTACTPVVASLDPTFLTCGDLNLAFQNDTDGPAIQNWFWTFGDPASGAADTSLLQFPSHTFSAAGVYTVKLVVNKGLPCSDSTEQEVSVYPGFFTGFTSAAPYCVNVPVQFTDTTRTNHGFVNQWHWNFGVNSTLADTSNLQNPSYTFTTPGTYNVQLISGNNLGCRDTLEVPIVINPSPVLQLLSADTTYCGLDSLQLTAMGTGNFTWTPGTNILGANTATPTVFPTVATTYTVTLESLGCRSSDTVRLTPQLNLSNDIAALPTTICQDDTLTLTGSSNKNDNLRWQWSPAASVVSPNTQSTRAFPMVTTNYTLQTTWGNHCVVSKTISIPVTPLAIPQAGGDVDYCAGQAPVQLTASGGNSYRWSPAAGLSASNIANPFASPAVTTSYIVAVGVAGCAKTKTDTVIVTVRAKPTVQITNDTLICVPDTLQLNVAGTGSIAWSPNYMINNVQSFTPLVSPDVPTTYRMRYTDLFGCFQDDSVFVDVKPQVTLNAGADTSICLPDAFRLRATGDAVSYTWVPNLYLDNANIKNPTTRPDATITYT
ncbi:MAG: PKD domain-containing protein, partial [Sphingobacteriales bacterium]